MHTLYEKDKVRFTRAEQLHDDVCVCIGTGDDTVLRQVVLPIVSDQVCQETYERLTDNMLCAGTRECGKDSCQGDSGGPLVCKQGDKWLQYGIVSFGYGCAQPNTPGVYTNVANLLSWIEQKSGSQYRHIIVLVFTTNAGIANSVGRVITGIRNFVHVGVHASTL